MFIIMKPASLRLPTYDGGVRNAKQVLPADSAEHLPTPVSSVSTCSRLPIWKSAARNDLTGSKKPLPPFGGRPLGAMPMTTSPVALSVMPSAGPGTAPPLAACEPSGDVLAGRCAFV